MRWLTALLIGAILAFVVPMLLGGQERQSGSRPGSSGGRCGRSRNRRGLLFSIPIFLGSAIALRLFFNWHRN